MKVEQVENLLPTDEKEPENGESEPISRRKPRGDLKLLPPMPEGVRKGGKIDQETAINWLSQVKGDEGYRLLLIYVYRVYPPIRRDPRYIEKFEGLDTKDFSLQWLKASFGGGSYHIKINSLAGEELLYFNCDFSPTIIEPILDLEELDDTSPKAEKFILSQQRLGKLKIVNGKLVAIKDGEQNQMSQTQNDPVAMMQATSQLIKESISMSRSSAPKEDKTSELLLALLTQANEDRKAMALQAAEDRRENARINSENQKTQNELMIRLITKDPPAKDNTFLEFIMTELKSTKEQTTTLLTKLMDQKPPANPLDQMMKTMEAIEQLKSFGNSAEETPKSWQDKLVDIGTSVLPVIASGLMAQRSGVAPEVGIQQALTSKSNFETVPLTEVVPVNPLDKLLLENGGLLAAKINANERGWEFGALMVEMFGKPNWNQIASLGEVEILASMNRVTQFRQAIGTFSDDYLKTWVKEFLNYEELIEQDEKELVN